MAAVGDIQFLGRSIDESFFLAEVIYTAVVRCTTD
jgi:hypothetical protein